jgi:MoxR-like ATPase
MQSSVWHRQRLRVADVAKLSLAPILAVTSPILSALKDARTEARYDSATDNTIIEVFAPSGANTARALGATLTATRDNTSAGAWVHISVDLTADADATVAARVNRLLDGTNAPRVEKYHRTGKMVVRLAGHPMAVPCGFTLSRSPDGSWSVPSFTPSAPAPAIIQPLPRPTVTTYQQAVAGIIAQGPLSTSMAAAIAAIGGAPPPSVAAFPSVPVSPTSPAPEPEPVAIEPPAAPSIKVSAERVTRPACSCPVGACLFTYPDPSGAGRIITSPLTQTVIRAAVKKHRTGERATLALVGPKGTGKTELVWDAAAEHGAGLFVFDGAGATSFADWTGTTALVTEDGRTVTRWLPSAFIEAISQDGPHGNEERWVLIDELNRAELSGALNALMPILSAAAVYIPETGRTIRVSRNVMFLFTLNRGSAYNATVTLDAALSDRIQSWVRTDYLPDADETALIASRTGLDHERAGSLVRVARQVREIADRGEVSDGISTRRILDAASMVMHGLTLREAAEVCWANYYPDEGGAEGERGIVLTAINASLV